MFVLLALCLLAALAQASSDEKPNDYCIDQPAGVESFPGDSASLSCRFVYPKKPKEVMSKNIAWRSGKKPFESSTEIYSSTRTRRYDDRISLVGDPQTDQNATIIIKNLTASDTNDYYCRVQIIYQDETTQQWQDINGTRLTVRDKNSLAIHQPSIMAAAVGDTVTIPCQYSTAGGFSVSLSSVWWHFGTHPSCNATVFNKTDKDDKTKRWRVLKGSASLQIRKVNSSNSGFYCCEVKGKVDKRVYQNKRERGTHVIVTEKTNLLNISQPREVIFNKPTTINCSFTDPLEKDPVWVGVYWLVGDSKDVFAFHPIPDLIHSDYKGKTRLIGKSNLLLEEFHGPDNTKFYCRVAIRQCVTGHRLNLDPFNMILEQGPGTVLRVYDSSNLTPIILGTVLSGVFLIILIVALICFRKRKGAYREQSHSRNQFPVPKAAAATENTEYEVLELYMQKSQQGADVVYSAVDHSATSVSSKQKHAPNLAQEIVYTTVKTSRR